MRESTGQTVHDAVFKDDRLYIDSLNMYDNAYTSTAADNRKERMAYDRDNVRRIADVFLGYKRDDEKRYITIQAVYV